MNSGRTVQREARVQACTGHGRKKERDEIRKEGQEARKKGKHGKGREKRE
jgi:hypothetical protein